MIQMLLFAPSLLTMQFSEDHGFDGPSMWISSVASISKVLCTSEVDSANCTCCESVRHSAAWHKLLMVSSDRLKMSGLYWL